MFGHLPGTPMTLSELFAQDRLDLYTEQLAYQREFCQLQTQMQLIIEGLTKLHLFEQNLRLFGVTQELMHLCNADGSLSRLFNRTLPGTEFDEDANSDVSAEELLTESEQLRSSLLDKLKGMLSKLMDDISKVLNILFKSIKYSNSVMEKYKETYETLDIPEDEFPLKPVKGPTADVLITNIGYLEIINAFINDISQYNGVDKGHADKLLSLYTKFYQDTDGLFITRGRPDKLVGWEGKFRTIYVKITSGTTEKLGYQSAEDISTLGKKLAAICEAILHTSETIDKTIDETYGDLLDIDWPTHFEDADFKAAYCSMPLMVEHCLLFLSKFIYPVVDAYVKLITTLTKA